MWASGDYGRREQMIHDDVELDLEIISEARKKQRERFHDENGEVEVEQELEVA